MQTLPINIRVPIEMREKIAAAMKKTGMKNADVLRASIELGLESLMLVEKTPIERIKDEIREAKSKQLESLPDSPPKTKRNHG